MLRFDEAIERVLSGLAPLGTEELPLDDAAGRVLATDISARWPLPPYDNSAMDGFAVRAAEVGAASPSRPVRLRRVEPVYAGGRPSRVASGEAARIATGARIPDGADAVVRQETAASRGEWVEVFVPVAPGENIRRRGEEVSMGQTLLRAGSVIDAATIGVLAAFGHDRVCVAARPKVAILPTGDELRPAAEATGESVAETNSHVLAALARESGGVPTRLALAPDDPEVIAERLREALGSADVLVTIGGASVGDRDVARQAFERLGAEISFWGVAIKPGKPIGFGRCRRKLAFALPGNPAAAAMTFELFVRPALLRLQGARDCLRPALRAHLVTPVKKQLGLTGFLRGTATEGSQGMRISLPERRAPGQITSAVGTNAIAILPQGREAFGAGERVKAWLVGPLLPTNSPPMVCFVGPSRVGKTTLIERLIVRLRQEGLRVGAVKHSHHGFEMDREGKDTDRFRRAGANAVAITSNDARATLAWTAAPTPLSELVATLPADLDLVLVEGYRGDDAPQIGVYRTGLPDPASADGIADIEAIVTHDPAAGNGLPRFDPGDVEGICGFIRSLACRSRPEAASGGQGPGKVV